MAVKIKGKGFLLRSPLKKDANTLWENYNDKEIAKNMVKIETEREFKKEFLHNLRKDNNKKINFKLIIDIDNMPVGIISLRSNDEYNLTKATISYWLGKKYRGKGIITKAIKFFTNYVFKKYKLVRIQANVRIFNKASIRVLEKAGYKLEGIRRKNTLKNGKYYDDYLYARVK